MLELTEKELLKVILEEQLKISQKLDKLLSEKGTPEINFTLKPIIKEGTKPTMSDKQWKEAYNIPIMPIIRSEWDEEIPLKNSKDEVLAVCYVKEKKMKIDVKKDLTVDTSPFNTFFINRIIEPLKRQNKEVVFDLLSDEGNLKELFIHNLDGRQRKEVINSLRWTLEKMYERGR